MNHKFVSSAILVILSSFQALAMASAINAGEILHKEHCQECHQNDIYESPDRKVENLSQLNERVKQCELMNELLWFDEDVNDVTSYLNQNYYRFDVNR